MRYKGYRAAISYQDDINAFHGRVVDIWDIVSFEGTSIEELEREFKASVDDYLAMCAQRGEEPNKPFSGNVALRMSPELHRRAHTMARTEGKSLNAWLADAIEGAVSTR